MIYNTIVNLPKNRKPNQMHPTGHWQLFEDWFSKRKSSFYLVLFSSLSHLHEQPAILSQLELLTHLKEI